jgi:BMFP domain-containing protein YqiC
MIGPKALEELTRRVYDALPEGIERLQEDVKKNVRAALEAALARMDLITREEFEVQSAVLARTREKIDALEKTVARLEEQAGSGTANAETTKTRPARGKTSPRRHRES